MLYRRFAYVLEFDRNGGSLAGSKEQQKAIRDELNDLMGGQGSLMDRTMRALAKVHKKYWNDVAPADRLPILTTFVDGVSGHGQAHHIWIGTGWTGDNLISIWFHELGHVVGINLFNPQDRTEHFAHMFSAWCANGCPANHWTWEQLQPVVEAILSS